MLISDISVKRPVFAAVISLLLLAFGLLAFSKLPLREYPDIDPPIVSVETSYPGASAAIVETKVTQLLEDSVSGIEGIKYIQSSSKDGRSEITIEFNLNRDVDVAANDVRDRVSRVARELPREVDQPQISKVDANTDVIIWLNFSSAKMNNLELTDYANRYLVDRFAVLDGVARVRIGGGRQYAMRIWLDRQAMAARNLTASDVENVLRAENVELPAGRIESDQREFTVRVARSYLSPDDFKQMVLVRGEDGALVRLGEVARVELGAEDERSELRGNGEAMVGIGIIKQSRANTLAVARATKAEVDRVNTTLPEGTALHQSYDTSIFIEASINEVYHTLGIALVLVVLVIYVFLGNVRATLIPAVTVPVSLISSFLALYAFGYSLNLLTLLALVLAIGLVVDDAVIVLENVHRRIEKGEPPLLAAYRGTRQVGFAVVATTLVLVAVFLPITYLEGNVGRLFTEFAVAMASAVAFSGLVALTLSPMMCSKMLLPHARQNRLTQTVERRFAAGERLYRRLLGRALDRRILMSVIIAAVAGVIVLCGHFLHSEFAPREDRGVFFILIKGPEGASFDYTKRYVTEVEKSLLPLLKTGEATRVLSRVPLSFSGTEAVNDGISIVVLSEWNTRNRSVKEIVQSVTGQVMGLPGVLAIPITPAGLGQRSFAQPVQFVIGGSTYEELATYRDALLQKISTNPRIMNVDVDYRETKPQIQVIIDRNRAADLGVSLENIGRTLETMLALRKVTTYPDRGEEYDVILQGEKSDFRQPYDVSNIFVRSERTRELIPLSNLVTFKEIAESSSLNRYNRIRAITIGANLAPGYALGDALNYMEETAKSILPPDARIDYKGESLEYKRSGGSVYFVFLLAMLVVYLLLAAQFESFIHPLVIMITVPLAVAGALAGLIITGQTLNIYSQIGIIMLVGLAAKNGILIVEFTNQLRDAGVAFREALVRAASIRLRPILMTSFTTAMGAVPLLLATGAGAESRLSIGVVVFFGVIAATFLTLFIVPFAYYMLARNTSSPHTVGNRLLQLEQQHEDRDI